MLCHDNKTFYFLLERNPSITSSAQKVVLKPGQGLNEWCKAYSHSEAEITWYLDDQQVHDGYGYTITSSLPSEAKQSTLKADTMDVRKSGQYKCVACNIGNCTSEVIHVYIEGEYRVLRTNSSPLFPLACLQSDEESFSFNVGNSIFNFSSSFT